MNWLDDELRTLLQRKEPPEGFAERVLARVEVAPSRLNVIPRRRRTLFYKSWVGWVAAAAACLILAFGFVWHQREQRTRAEAELASQQAAMALRIASSQFNIALQQAAQVTQQALDLKTKNQSE